MKIITETIIYKTFALFQKVIQMKASLMYHQKNPHMVNISDLYKNVSSLLQ